MRLFDEKGRLFGKINIVDLFVVLVILSVIVWFGYAKFFRNLGKDIADREKPIEITVIVTGVRPTTAEAIEASGSFFEFVTGARLGELKETSVEPSDTWEILDSGAWARTKNSGKVDVYLTIRGNARIGEDTILMNGVEVRVGATLGLKSKMVQVQGNVLTMDLEPEDTK